MMQEEMRDWANLPTDIMILIIQHLLHIEDFYSITAVCKPWQSITLMFDNKLPSLPPRSPFVLVTPSKRRLPKFYTLLATSRYEFELPEASQRRFLGTCHGWLFTTDHKKSYAHLLHPFSKQQINLPPLFVFKSQSMDDCRLRKYSYTVKLAMSRNPLPEKKEDCIVLVIARYNPILAFAKIGDRVWTRVSPHKKFHDVVHYKGVFYAVDGDGVLYICDVSNDNENAIKAITPRFEPLPQDRCDGNRCDQMYLVESSGDLLLVSRCRFSSYWLLCQTTDLYVYKLEHNEDERDDGGYPYRWKEVDNLGGRALLVGGNASVSVRPSKRVKADYVYFCNEDFRSVSYGHYGGDTGVYNVRNKIIKRGASTDLHIPVWYF